MKRATKKVEKRTYTLKNAVATFVSIVSRGANFTPLSELRYSDDSEKFSEVEINRIVFSKDNFTREGVETYLAENDYEDCEIFEDEAAYVVPGVEEAAFAEIAPIEYGDGVQFFVGKLLAPTDTNQTAVEVTDAEVLDFNQPEETQVDPENQEVNTDEIVQEGDLSVEDLKPNKDEVNEEVATEGTEALSEEVEGESQVAEGETEVVQENEAEVVADEVATDAETQGELFNQELYDAEVAKATEAFNQALADARELASRPVEVEAPVVFSQEDLDLKIAEALEAYKQTLITEKDEKTIDETTIVVQNSQAVNSEEISVSRDKPENAKFSDRKTKDLFGL